MSKITEAFKQIRNRLLTIWRRPTGWPDPAKDETHATYRRQYETLLPTLKHLPRGVSHERAIERRSAFLYLAEILDGLHNYGDDPILPPGIRRAVLKEAAPEGLQARSLFAPVSAASPLAGILASPATWVAVAFALPATWGAIQTGRLSHAKHDLAEARADLAATERSLAAAETERNLLAEHARVAAAQSQQTAANINAERARRVRTERELRRIRDAMAQAGSGEPIDYGFGSVRDAGSPASPDSGSGAAPGNPR